MRERPTAKVYLDAGGLVLSFKIAPLVSSAAAAIKKIDTMLKTLKKLGVPHFEKDLQRLKEGIKEASQASPEAYKSEIPDPHASEWGAIANAIDNMFDQVASERMLVVLDQSTVSESLNALHGTSMEDHERIILNECTRCLQISAYRAAIVMGWNLVYEHVRQWLFQSKARLAKFNAELSTRNRTKTLKHDPISSYDDFMTLGEHFCLEVGYAASLWTKQQNQILQNALTDRNHFAHPSLRKVTSHSAAGFIDNLVVNILTAKDFARRKKRAKKTNRL